MKRNSLGFLLAPLLVLGCSTVSVPFPPELYDDSSPVLDAGLSPDEGDDSATDAGAEDSPDDDSVTDAGSGDAGRDAGDAGEASGVPTDG